MSISLASMWAERLNVNVLADNKVAVDFYEENGLRPRSINLSQDL